MEILGPADGCLRPKRARLRNDVFVDCWDRRDRKDKIIGRVFWKGFAQYCCLLQAALVFFLQSMDQTFRKNEGGDEAIVQLRLKPNIKVNDTDAKGNTALHWTLKLSRLFPQHIRIMWLLLEHGALVHHRNKLGLTAFDIAAGNGHSEARGYNMLSLLLLQFS